jgi:hypothetical protein
MSFNAAMLCINRFYNIMEGTYHFIIDYVFKFK